MYFRIRFLLNRVKIPINVEIPMEKEINPCLDSDKYIIASNPINNINKMIENENVKIDEFAYRNNVERRKELED